MTDTSRSLASAGAEPLLEFDGITKSFGAVRALRGVDFELLPGEVHALLGQNGAGKSTLIKILAGVNQKDGGRTRIMGRDTEFRSPSAARDAGLAVVYQELSLVPSMTVAQNLYLGREPHNRLGLVPRRKLVRDAQQFLEEHELPLDPNALVGDLPFAYKQLTEIAKALIGRGNILVLDEPTSALSGGEEEILFDAIGQVTKRGVGVIYVTHRLGEVFRLSQRVTVLRDGANVGTFKTSDTDMATLVSAIVGPEQTSFAAATIVGLGPNGETPESPERLRPTDADAEAARKARFKVGVAMHTMDLDWARQQVQAIRDTLTTYGAELIGITDASFKAQRQSADLDQMIALAPDAIISIPVDVAATAAAYRRVADAGIKLVFMSQPAAGLTHPADYACVVSQDMEGTGFAAAELLAAQIAPRGTVGLVDFGIDFYTTNQRTLAVRRWLADNRPDIIIKETAFLDPSDAERVTADFLAANPDVSGLFVPWDAPAMDAVRAARAAGRKIPITTSDLGNEVATEMASGGLVKGLGAQQPYEQGIAEAQACILALLGRDTPPWVVLPAVSVTVDNLLEQYERIWHEDPPAALSTELTSSRSPSGGQPRRVAEHRDGLGHKPLLELRKVHNERLRGVDLVVAPGEIVGLAGMVGSGRTEILETVFGLRRAASGELLLKGERVVIKRPTDAIRRGIALAPEDRHVEGLVLEHSIERNLALPRLPQLGRFGFFRRKASNDRALAAMRELSVKAPSPRTPVRNLSGGNQQKVVFARWVDPDPTLLLLDEPTVGVDVGAREEIYGVVRGLADRGCGVLVVSSELVELLLICDRIGIVKDGRIIQDIARADVRNEEHLHHLVQGEQLDIQKGKSHD